MRVLWRPRTGRKSHERPARGRKAPGRPFRQAGSGGRPHVGAGRWGSCSLVSGPARGRGEPTAKHDQLRTATTGCKPRQSPTVGEASQTSLAATVAALMNVTRGTAQFRAASSLARSAGRFALALAPRRLSRGESFVLSSGGHGPLGGSDRDSVKTRALALSTHASLHDESQMRVRRAQRPRRGPLPIHWKRTPAELP